MDDLFFMIFDSILDLKLFGALKSFSLICKLTASIIRKNHGRIFKTFLEVKRFETEEKISKKNPESAVLLHYNQAPMLPNGIVHGIWFKQTSGLNDTIWFKIYEYDVPVIRGHIYESRTIRYKPIRNGICYVISLTENNEVDMYVAETIINGLESGQYVNYDVLIDPLIVRDVVYKDDDVISSKPFPITPGMLEDFKARYFELKTKIGEVPSFP